MGSTSFVKSISLAFSKKDLKSAQTISPLLFSPTSGQVDARGGERRQNHLLAALLSLHLFIHSQGYVTGSVVSIEISSLY